MLAVFAATIARVLLVKGELQHMSKREQRANGDMVSYAGGSFAQSSRSMCASDPHSYSDASIQALVVR